MTPEADDAPGGADRPQDDEAYEVGYGRPPTATRFRPGQSGNPKGRPKGSRNAKTGEVDAMRLKSLIMEEAYRVIQVRDGGKTRAMSILQASLRSLGMQSAQGKQGAMCKLFELVGAVEREQEINREQTFKVILEYKRGAEKEILEARRLGRDAPDILPHPDDLIIDPYAGTVTLKGPMTPEEKAYFDHVRYLKSGYEEDLAWEMDHPEDAIDGDSTARQRILIDQLDRILNHERIIVGPTSE